MKSFNMRSGNIHLVVAAALLLLFEAAALVCCNHQNTTTTFHCVESERQALLKFKSCFNDSSHMLSSWKGNDCCMWKGVGCDKTSQHVVSLNLRSEGEWWREHNSLVINGGDDVAPSLLELKFLEHLDLSGNDFNYTNIPPSFGLMKQLRYLNLSNAYFGGRIPPQLGNLTSLRVLGLGSYYDVVLEAGHDIRWVSQLGSLQHLDMVGVNLSSATSPNVFQVLNNLHSLSWLSLSGCGLNSSHPLLGKNHHPFNFTFLRNIQYLDLSYNSFQGPIPDFISNMTSLKSLHLSWNGFVGPIPSFIVSMTSLRDLDLSWNGFVGQIPSFIESITTLEELNLSWNHLNGTIPAWVEGGKSIALQRLDLSFNQLSGGFPNNIGQLSELESLHLKSNNLNGSIPDSIGQLSKLEVFVLSQNKLTGAIPESIGGLSNLKRLDFSHNLLEGVVSEAHFAGLSNLTLLDIGYNRLNCEIKSNWIPPFQLEYIILNSCKLRARFPKWIQSQHTILVLDLSNTSISGSIPKDIGHMMPALISLDLANNHLNGSIPKSLCNPPSLFALDISNNQLSGNIPRCWRYGSYLSFIDLSSNNLSGLIPSSIGQLESLELLRLNNNSLHGEMPSALGNCTNLAVLDLGENDLSGNITWIGESPRDLWVLRLRKNKFSGNFPSELCYLFALQILDLADNRLSGELPSCFDHLICMVNATLCDNPDNNTAPVKEFMKGTFLEYESGIAGMLYNLDLSSNKLVGSIPKQLTLLTGLIGLNLSHNLFSGAIPENIGQLNNLESLDLSRNGLSGTIPSSLSSINVLSHLNLSYNNLSGPIPTGNQLQTLEDPASIYMGNPLLCGPPLLTKCQSDAPPPTSTPSQSEDSHEDDHEKMWLYLIVASGFATGFWGVVGVLIFMKSWRYALFRMVDDVQDRIYVAFALKVKRIKKVLNRNPDDQ